MANVRAELNVAGIDLSGIAARAIKSETKDRLTILIRAEAEREAKRLASQAMKKIKPAISEGIQKELDKHVTDMAKKYVAQATSGLGIRRRRYY